MKTVLLCTFLSVCMFFSVTIASAEETISKETYLGTWEGSWNNGDFIIFVIDTISLDGKVSGRYESEKRSRPQSYRAPITGEYRNGILELTTPNRASYTLACTSNGSKNAMATRTGAGDPYLSGNLWRK